MSEFSDLSLLLGSPRRTDAFFQKPSPFLGSSTKLTKSLDLSRQRASSPNFLSIPPPTSFVSNVVSSHSLSGDTPSNDRRLGSAPSGLNPDNDSRLDPNAVDPGPGLKGREEKEESGNEVVSIPSHFLKILKPSVISKMLHSPTSASTSWMSSAPESAVNSSHPLLDVQYKKKMTSSFSNPTGARHRNPSSSVHRQASMVKEGVAHRQGNVGKEDDDRRRAVGMRDNEAAEVDETGGSEKGGSEKGYSEEDDGASRKRKAERSEEGKSEEGSENGKDRRKGGEKGGIAREPGKGGKAEEEAKKDARDKEREHGKTPPRENHGVRAKGRHEERTRVERRGSQGRTGGGGTIEMTNDAPHRRNGTHPIGSTSRASMVEGEKTPNSQSHVSHSIPDHVIYSARRHPHPLRKFFDDDDSDSDSDLDYAKPPAPKASHYSAVVTTAPSQGIVISKKNGISNNNKNNVTNNTDDINSPNGGDASIASPAIAIATPTPLTHTPLWLMMPLSSSSSNLPLPLPFPLP
eukprot:CAMPEP_0175080252 /NCGR_PEP_ID=MMETSP0052_2-20121109/25384_1 /TAXON_ID=51329 ORGANISM="Polytomella parva, Strain SAG 63-3" /NCGR_SAMPLE_ID=MMETSP0052_2 /ASSEMBLY_ACC=CAM_ASM_000194 /LENGTH=518 /DNA_ID=CAMNT_0016350891 /DNA_START=253 /DNA_END=1805 /DNA_ORIENTATION=-